MGRSSLDLTVKKKKLFLKHLSMTGNIMRSAELADIDRMAFYDWKRKDPKFAEEADKAFQDAVDMMEAEAAKRATEGTEEPVYYKGEIVGHVRRKSDILLMFMLKGNRPKYRDNVPPPSDAGNKLDELVRAMQAGGVPKGTTNETTDE